MNGRPAKAYEKAFGAWECTSLGWPTPIGSATGSRFIDGAAAVGVAPLSLPNRAAARMLELKRTTLVVKLRRKPGASAEEAVQAADPGEPFAEFIADRDPVKDL